MHYFQRFNNFANFKQFLFYSFDPEDDRWTLVESMHYKRLGVGVAVVNRLLYAIGGFDGNERLATIERYHPEDNAWTIIPSMSIGRSGAGVAALNQYIYVVGGFDGTRQLSSVERFDTEQLIWSKVASIKIARSALSLTVLDGKLYAMGGFDGHNFLSIVEVYDPELNVWEDGTPLTSGRSGHASAVIFEPSCVSSFSNYLRTTSMDTDNDDSHWPDNDPNGKPNTSASSTMQNLSNAGGNSEFASFSGSICNNCTKQKSKLSNTTYYFYKLLLKKYIHFSISFINIITTSQTKFQSVENIGTSYRNHNFVTNILQIFLNVICLNSLRNTFIIPLNNYEFPLYVNENPKKYKKKK